jgi:hypothetical protein
MFCAPGLIFEGNEDVGSRLHVLHSQTRFLRYRGRRVQFSCFALLDAFWSVSSASGPVFMFCAPGLVLGDTEGAGLVFIFCALGLIFDSMDDIRYHFHVLCSLTHICRYRERRVSPAYFALPVSFSAVPRASGPVFMFCDPGLVLVGTEVVGSNFNVLRFYTHFRLYQGCLVPFACFALLESFFTVRRSSSPIFMFCAPKLVLGGTEGAESSFHVLRSRTHFRRYWGRRVSFSCFALPNSFSTVPRTSGLVFIFRAPELIRGGTEDVESRFHVLR